jgi:diacylglycerol kinase family enzyme
MDRSAAMRFRTVLNKDGGTLRDLDVAAFARRAAEVIEAGGHQLEADIVKARHLGTALERAARDPEVDIVMAGGGDGTAAAAAAAVMDTGKALALLPAGTMNMFARTLRIPLDLEAALAAFATGRIVEVDIASANGRPFVHQFSIGMHPRLVELRSRMPFRSRLGKVGATLKAAIDTIRNPSILTVTLRMPHAEFVATTAGLSVSNNLYGEGHLPFADRPDGGVLGVYVTSAQGRAELLLVCLNVLLGRWRRNEKIEIHESRSATIVVETGRRRRRCVMDGELFALEPETRIEIHPKALRVLVPAEVPVIKA